MDNMANKYGKGIVCAETDWPTKCSKASANIPSSLSSVIPFSAAGQVMWVTQLADIVKAVPNGLGMGVMYWEPGWIDNQVFSSLHICVMLIIAYVLCANEALRRHWVVLVSRVCSSRGPGVMERL